jgi:diguanylate cyclase (GGDEF)-like protein
MAPVAMTDLTPDERGGISMDRFGLLVCDDLKHEAAAVLGSEGLEDVGLAAFAPHCAPWGSLQRPALHPVPAPHLVQPAPDPAQSPPAQAQPAPQGLEIEEALRGCERKYSRICIIAGACGSPLEKMAGELPANCHVHAAGHCAYLFLNRAIVGAYIRDGACLLLPGWLRRWRQEMVPGQDRKKAARSLAGAFNRLVLIDTGVDNRSHDYLKELAGDTGLPYEAVPAGLDLFRLVIRDLVNQWRLESESLYRTRSKVTEERLKYLSFHDVLTGLYNRSYFEEELKRLDVKRQLPLSIIMGDVNGLKLVNDTLGHQTGDKLIREAGKILKKICRKEEIICRWGGDEFAILLPRADRVAAEKICDRIRKACEEGGEESIPLSFGLGTGSKENPDQPIESVLKEAEDNMYRDKLLDSRSSRFSMIVFFQKALAEKSAETPEHGRRIRDLALKVGDALGLSNRELEELDILAALHDIGQIAIPGDILSKPCYLDSEEWELMKKHPEIGERIVRTVPNLIDIAEAILCHHEYWDGTGYPRKLREEQIPLLSRILAIADAYDVMTGGRPYKKAVSHQEAIDEIRKCAGTQFDPELVGQFIKLVSRGG